MSSQDYASFQAALARAKAAADADVFVVTRTYYGAELEFSFRPRATPDAIEIIGKLTEQSATIQKAADGDIDASALDSLMKIVTEFLDAQAVGDTAQRIAECIHANVIGVAELFDIQRAVIEQVAGRPTMSASSSPSGPSQAGQPSTDGALPDPLTPAI